MAKPERLYPALLGVGNITVPLAPSTLAVTGRTHTTVGLSWVAPLSDGGSAITDYTIEYSSNGGVTYTAFAHAASAVAAITVTGLVKGTAYLFRVAAVSAIGTGPVSDPAAQTTDAEPGAPTGLAVAAFTDTTVGLTWVAPASDGGRAVTDYLVEFSDDDGGSWDTFAHGASAAVAITVTGLTAETTYLFRVSAVNVVGTGPASAPVEQTTAEPADPFPGYVVYDEFTDANGTDLDVHVPDKYPFTKWFESVGTWDVVTGGFAQCTASGGDGQNVAVINALAADVTVEAEVVCGIVIDARLVINWSNNTNYWLFGINSTGGWVLYKREDPFGFTLIDAGGAGFGAGTYLLKVVTAGNSIVCFIDGVEVSNQLIDTRAHQTETRFGLSQNGTDTTSKFTFFRIPTP